MNRYNRRDFLAQASLTAFARDWPQTARHARRIWTVSRRDHCRNPQTVAPPIVWRSASGPEPGHDASQGIPNREVGIPFGAGDLYSCLGFCAGA